MAWECQELSVAENVLAWWLALSCFPTIGYPQWRKQRQMRSHLGISLNNFQAAALVSWMNITIFVFREYDSTFSCCTADQPWYRCLNAMAPMLQLFVGWINKIGVVFLYFRYFDREGLKQLGRDPSKERCAAICCFIGMVGFMVLIVGVPFSLATIAGAVESLSVFYSCDILGGLMSVLLCTHWVLQIQETCALRSAGSFSCIAALLSAAASLLSAISFLARKAYGQTIVFILAGIMQCVVVGVVVYYERLSQGEHGSAVGASLVPTSGPRSK